MTISWLKMFLSIRHQFNVVSNFPSIVDVTSGVPQIEYSEAFTYVILLTIYLQTVILAYAYSPMTFTVLLLLGHMKNDYSASLLHFPNSWHLKFCQSGLVKGEEEYWEVL